MKTTFLIVVTCCGALSYMLSRGAVNVTARPAYMDRYDRDPYAREEYKNDCTLCHIGHGGAERNDFGDAFEDAGYRITPKLRSKFPQFFIAPK